MADNLSVTPGTGEKIPSKQLTHGGDTVQAVIYEIGVDNGTALTRLQGGRQVAASSLPIVQSADQVIRLAVRADYYDIPAAFTTIIDPTTGPYKIDSISGFNFTDCFIEITYGGSSVVLDSIPPGASFEENLADKGLMEAMVIKYRYALGTFPPTSGFLFIKALCRPA